MATLCSGIFSGAIISCDDPLFVGLTQRLFLANLDDVASITYDVTADMENVITAITMKSGKAFFEFAGVSQTIKAQSELIRGDLAVSYKHTVDLSVFDVASTSLLNMQGMAYKNQIAITVQPSDSSLANNAFGVYGVNIGMELLTNIRQLSENSTGGAFVLQLATPENGGTESSIPNPFWMTDYVTTLALIEGLLTPAV